MAEAPRTGRWASAPPDPDPAALLERDAELAVLAAAIDELGAGAGSLVWVEGTAGVGKTALVAAAERLARAAGVSYLAACGAELEAELPFGVVRQLLEPVVGGALATGRLAEDAAALATSALAPRAAAGSPEPEYAALHGLYWLLADLTRHGPLVLAIDDAHWADGPSLRFVDFLCRRLAGLPALLLLTARPEAEWPRREVRARLLAGPPWRILRPQPLSVEAVATLIARALPAAPEPAFSRACHELTAGNPFYLHELLGEVSAAGIAPVASSVERLRAARPGRVVGAVFLHLGRRSPAARALAAALAVLGDGADLELAARLGGLAPQEALAAWDELAGAGVLASAPRLAFAHPIVRSVVYEDLGAAVRAQRHGQAAALLRARGAAGERIALHLLHSAPMGDSDVAELLRDVAREALARGATEPAVAYLRRALAEHADRPDPSVLLFELGEAELLVGEPEAAARLRAAARQATEPAVRVGALQTLGRTLALAGRLDAAADALRQARDQASATPDLALGPEIELASVLRARISTAPEGCRLVAGLAARQLDRASSLDRAALALIACDAALANRPAAEVAALATRALGQRPAETVLERALRYLAIVALVFADQLEAAERALAVEIAEARRTGSLTLYVTAMALHAAVALRRGDLPAAEFEAHAAIELGLERGWQAGQWMPLPVLAETLLERGTPQQAERTLDQFLGALDPEGGWAAASWLAQARLLLAGGQPRPALDLVLAAGRHQERWRAPAPNVIGWRSWAALAAHAAGERDLAYQLAAADLELARAFGAPGPIGVAWRTLATLRSGREGLEQARAAVRYLQSSPRRLELARAQLTLGRCLRLAGEVREARVELRAAADLAAGCGATALLRHSNEELRAAGARPRRPAGLGLSALTASELHIAYLAAQGLSNSAIAQALFVTTKTVEYHLTSVYRKLGASSRSQLPAKLQDPAGSRSGAPAQRRSPAWSEVAGIPPVSGTASLQRRQLNPAERQPASPEPDGARGCRQSGREQAPQHPAGDAGRGVSAPEIRCPAC